MDSTEKEEVPIRNGEIWEQARPSLLQARTQWIDVDQWMLLSIPCRAVHGGSCMVAMTEADGTMFYTAAELHRRLLRDGWRKLSTPPIERVLQDIQRY